MERNGRQCKVNLLDSVTLYTLIMKFQNDVTTFIQG
jgi:hypothetical protein